MKRISQWLAPPLALLVLAGVILITVRNMNADQPGPPPSQEEAAIHPDVSVTVVEPGSYQATITGLGEAGPHFELTLVAEINGLVEDVSSTFETGQLLEKGDIVLSIDATEYSAAVAEAENNLAQSTLELLEEERQVTQARSEWNSSGLEGEPDSELVLRRPQLAAAQAAVKTAEAALELARKNLEKTQVTVPFDCLVVSRGVAPGSYLQSGSEIGVLYSIDKQEVAVSFSLADWANLPPTSELTGRSVRVIGVENGQSWQGKVSRVENHLDTKTRQRTVVVGVEEPLSLSDPLLAGTFVRVEIAGKQIDNLWKLPASALSQRGKIWYVTRENALACFSAQPAFSDHNYIYVQPPQMLRESMQNVLIHPLSSYLVGMRVKPVKEVSDEQV